MRKSCVREYKCCIVYYGTIEQLPWDRFELLTGCQAGGFSCFTAMFVAARGDLCTEKYFWPGLWVFLNKFKEEEKILWWVNELNIINLVDRYLRLLFHLCRAERICVSKYLKRKNYLPKYFKRNKINL